MQTAASPYQPVRERRTLTCFLLALLMHLLLGALLYYGVRWRNAVPTGVAAELWEPVPAATAPEPAVRPAPTPRPVEEEDADISLQEKQRKAREAEREAEQRRQRESQALAEAARKEAQRKAMEAQRQASNAERQAELARLRAQAGGAGATANTGAGSGSSARPSSGYAERVRQRVKPNIIFNEDVPGNPAAVVAVHMAPDGSLLSTRLARSSGNAGWDSAVLRAVQRSDPLPRDSNGVAPSNILITFWPKDEGG
ncbi:cell envelope integrity protein TolA [Cupriavidus alkaliphilus]|uniref:cell envelope integrity protein TolA n=1 Tax=Cupriavidus alkaliphilus TaxID=942866 RepID=UPI000DC258FA|nr:cell envelope integrity protein TolA [Cupriavidus alkaliphilus]MBB2918573.1 colicin import membrane protein [Cupriavidus alkaliphilus]RAS01236.1 colicin import membrane protein [Cupriavidus alkaliphilus]